MTTGEKIFVIFLSKLLNISNKLIPRNEREIKTTRVNIRPFLKLSVGGDAGGDEIGDEICSAIVISIIEAYFCRGRGTAVPPATPLPRKFLVREGGIA